MMSSAVGVTSKMTAEEFLAWEEKQLEKHEFWAGEVFSQAGGTRRHSIVGSNTLIAIGKKLTGPPCIANGSDMLVHVEATGYYAYPDISVVCPPLTGENDRVISNPVLLVEVTSPSTEDFDRGGKFDHYRRIPSLQEYLVVSQREPRVEQYTRTDDGNWLLREIVGIDQAVQLQSLKLSLLLREMYDKVDFVES